MRMKLRHAGLILAGAAAAVVCVESVKLRAENRGGEQASAQATKL